MLKVVTYQEGYKPDEAKGVQVLKEYNRVFGLIFDPRDGTVAIQRTTEAGTQITEEIEIERLNYIREVKEGE